MPKQKNKKAATKRFKISGTGKIRRRKEGTRHLLSHESSKLKRSRQQDVEVKGADKKKVKNMIPYM